MKITYYRKDQDQGVLIATVGVQIDQWHMTINNISILKGKSGWFITLPSYKNKETDEWEKVIEFPPEIQQRFLKSIRELIEEYAKEKGDVLL